MPSSEISARILEVRIVPVVRASSGEQARMAVDAVYKGGIPVVELTMTVPGGVDVIRDLAREHGSEILIGAGTVLDAKTAERCLSAGAQFVVSPGFDSETVALVKRRGKLMMAGGLTPTEVIAAWKAGSDFVKVYPCGPLGGPKYIKALKGPLPQIPMVPTGGVNLENAADFMRAGSAALGVGGELIPSEALRLGKMDVITNLARQFVAAVQTSTIAARAARSPSLKVS